MFADLWSSRRIRAVLILTVVALGAGTILTASPYSHIATVRVAQATDPEPLTAEEASDALDLFLASDDVATLASINAEDDHTLITSAQTLSYVEATEDMPAYFASDDQAVMLAGEKDGARVARVATGFEEEAVTDVVNGFVDLSSEVVAMVHQVSYSGGPSNWTVRISAATGDYAVYELVTTGWQLAERTSWLTFQCPEQVFCFIIQSFSCGEACAFMCLISYPDCVDCFAHCIDSAERLCSLISCPMLTCEELPPGTCETCQSLGCPTCCLMCTVVSNNYCQAYRNVCEGTCP
jgi:hypothetical protein